MKTMTALSLAAALVASSTVNAQTTAPPPVTKSKVETREAAKPAIASTAKPEAKKGWVMVEEWVMWPLHLEPHKALVETSAAFRRGEEKKAAAELRKAVSWLRLTESHATAAGRYELSEAIAKLDKIAADLDKGGLVDADRLSKGISTAYHAIANDHYLKAKEHHTGLAADKDSKFAAKHLIDAGLYLQEAARSAEHEFGKDVVSTLTVLNSKGQETERVTEFDHNLLADHLKHIGDGLQSLGAELQQP